MSESNRDTGVYQRASDEDSAKEWEAGKPTKKAPQGAQEPQEPQEPQAYEPTDQEPIT
jgi:hypothetical protein